MIGRLFMFLKIVWARPTIQTSFWLILESIVLWVADKVKTKFGTRKAAKKKGKPIKRKAKKTAKNESVKGVKPKAKPKKIKSK